MGAVYQCYSVWRVWAASSRRLGVGDRNFRFSHIFSNAPNKAVEWVKCETNGTTDIPGVSRLRIHARQARTIFVGAPAAPFVRLGKIRDFGLKSSWGRCRQRYQTFRGRRVSLAPAVPPHSPRVSRRLCTTPTVFLFLYRIPRRMHSACG